MQIDDLLRDTELLKGMMFGDVMDDLFQWHGVQRMLRIRFPIVMIDIGSILSSILWTPLSD